MSLTDGWDDVDFFDWPEIEDLGDDEVRVRLAQRGATDAQIADVLRRRDALG